MRPQFKKNAARVKNYTSCRCLQGHIHHSKGEAGHCNELEIRRKSGEFQEFVTQKRFDLAINGKKITSHIPDFLITNHDGTQFVEEFKGFETGEWVIKRKLFEALFPEIPYIVIKPKRMFQRGRKNER